MTKYAQITIAISDQCIGGLEGFAPLSERLPAEVFDTAVEDGIGWEKPGQSFCIILDLMDGRHSRIDEKLISLDQASRIMGVPSDTLVQIGRQRLAQIDDEDTETVRTLVDRRRKGERR